MEYKASSTTSNCPERMAAAAPVQVGTRGTVGSLVMKEIEYFNRLELDRSGSSQKAQAHAVDVGSSSGRSRSSFWFLVMTWRRKKRRSSTCLPSICSVVEVADCNRLNGIPGFNYRILKDDVKNMQL